MNEDMNNDGKALSQAASMDGKIAEITRASDQVRQFLLSQNDSLVGRERLLAQLALSIAAEAQNEIARQSARIEQLEHLVETDELTRVLNRRGFHCRLTRALADAKRRDESGLLVFVDLDGFKRINDTLGHAAGDEVLRTVARLLSAQVRETDSVGRLGGDEFVVLMTNTSWQAGWKRARELERLVNSASLAWLDKIVLIRASFGIEGFTGGDEVDPLLTRADEKMYQTKRRRAPGNDHGAPPHQAAVGAN